VPGKVAAAEGGTLLLDEVADLSAGAQAKLLQLLQVREYHPLGSTEAVRADVRIISATNADLLDRVATRQFREDLYYRLHVLPLAIPDLSERREDIPELVEHFCAEVCHRHKLAPLTVSPRALLACREASWPGNARQLAHAVEAAVIRAQGEGSRTLQEHHVFPETERAAGDDAPFNFQEATRRFQRRYVLEALERNDWNVAETARQLELARSHVYNLINDLGLKRNGDGRGRR
jgi:Nif-specific regulatory protein